MCKKAMYAAIGKIESDLASDERIIWSGFPDRQIICNKIKTFYWKNVAFFLTLGAAAATSWFFAPAQKNAIFIALGATALMRAIGAISAWSNRKKRVNMAYALTNKRLISVNGTNNEMASWYSPIIDSVRIQKHKNTSTLKLRDTELRFSMDLFYVEDASRLKSLLTPFIVNGVKAEIEKKPMPARATRSRIATRPSSVASSQAQDLQKAA
ncbi:hypothetical protein [Hirschia litorea]|uniref:YcxB-like protein domain-containing protein n=1 Tax=Hirschia litorea TaxID=1199156 RepID=A0ABW2IM03_9PROT